MIDSLPTKQPRSPAILRKLPEGQTTRLLYRRMKRDNRLAFQRRLLSDLYSLHEDGLDPKVEPPRLPALVEFAKAVNGKASNANALREVLAWAIGQSAKQLVAVFPRASSQNIITGLTELFGLSNTHSANLERRRDIAGPLLGYNSGNDGLRHGEHRKTKVEDLAIAEIARQLSGLAQKNGFIFSGRFVPKEIDSSATSLGHRHRVPYNSKRDDLSFTTSTDPMLTPIQVAEVQDLEEALSAELRKICCGGYSSVERFPKLQELSEVVTVSYPKWLFRPYSRRKDQLKSFLLWASEELGVNNAKGITALLGIEGDPSLTFTERHERAAQLIEVNDGKSYQGDDLEALVIRELCRVMVRAAIQTGYV